MVNNRFGGNKFGDKNPQNEPEIEKMVFMPICRKGRNKEDKEIGIKQICIFQHYLKED